MHKALTHLLVVCIGSITIVLIDRLPVEAYDIYYLTVGNAAYREERLNLRDANVSAGEIAQYLRWAGAVDGITLKSELGAYLTRDDVMSALKEIARKAKAARAPLVVYYFIGHGGSGRDNWSHVSFLGNYQSSDSAEVARSHAIIETREIKKSLEQLNLPYILILDNCYERKPVGGLEGFGQTLSGKVSEQTDTIARLGLREPAILLYAARPGHIVSAIAHPWEKRAIGPLARRLLLLLQPVFESKQGLSVGDFLKGINDPAFDPKSVPGDQKTWISNTGDVLIPSGGRSMAVESVGKSQVGSGGGAGRQ